MKKGCIDIGWGNLYDLNQKSIRNSSGSIRNRLKNSDHSWSYSALDIIESLETNYPDKFKLKLLGTHEKYLVCDRSWAVLGSHNFLSSGDRSQERELGLWTNDQRIIAELIQRFDKAKNREVTQS